MSTKATHSIETTVAARQPVDRSRHATAQLIDPTELDGEATPDIVRANREAFDTTFSWAQTYLTKPHPDLGRPGPVCPFVGPAVAAKLMRLAVIRGYPPADVIDETMTEFRGTFLQMAERHARSRQYLTFLLLFPDVATEHAPAVIDAAQQRLKPAFVRSGLMVGQFHPGPPHEPGLWNPKFRPLVSPVPLLAIRHMVSRDFPFLRDEPESVQAYLRLFGNRIPKHLRAHVKGAVERFALQFDGLATADNGGQA